MTAGTWAERLKELHNTSRSILQTPVLPKKKYTNNIWMGSFFERAPRFWNKLPDDVTSAKSLDIFKIRAKALPYEEICKKL